MSLVLVVWISGYLEGRVVSRRWHAGTSGVLVILSFLGIAYIVVSFWGTPLSCVHIWDFMLCIIKVTPPSTTYKKMSAAFALGDSIFMQGFAEQFCVIILVSGLSPCLEHQGPTDGPWASIGSRTHLTQRSILICAQEGFPHSSVTVLFFFLSI